jgi:hypothetical protein
LKQEGTFNNIRNRPGRGERGSPAQQQSNSASESIRDVSFQGGGKGGPSKQGKPTFDLEREKGFGEPQVNPNNPLREEAQPRGPWSPEKRLDEIDLLHQQFPNLTYNEIDAMAKENEARDLAQPEAERARDENLEKAQQKLETRFDQLIKTKLQKGDEEGVYEDITGEMLANAKRVMGRELRTNPNASVDDVAQRMSDKLLDLAKAKKQLTGLADVGLANPLKKSENLAKLKSYQKIFEQTGNKEEYFNLLQSDFSLSPQGAAFVAFPRSKKINEFLANSKRSNIHDGPQNSRKIASNIENLMTADDSLLAIARQLRESDPFFDQKAFFDQIREDQENIRLTPRQQRELGEGVSDITPSWGDLWTLPFFRGL